LNGAIVVFDAEREGGTTGGAQRGGRNGFGEGGALGAEAIKVGGANGDLRVARDPIESELVGEEKKDIGLVRHLRSLSKSDGYCGLLGE